MKFSSIHVRMLAYFVLWWSSSLVVSVTPTRTRTRNPRSTSDDFLVHGLEDIEPAFASFQGQMYAGLLPTTDYSSMHTQPIQDNWNASEEEDDGALYFWLFEPSKKELSSSGTLPPSSDSLLIWLNGGPGCSSFNGLFFECSPVTVPLARAGSAVLDESAPFMSNPYSWTNAPTNIMFVEQPMGTGFSYGPEPQNETDISQAFYNFLQNFYQAFPTYQTYELYIFGESYAGMFVPSIAHYIYKHNNKEKQNNTNRVRINLEGIGLGNGVVDPKIQGPVVIDYAYWHGMIDIPTKDALYKIWDDCMESNIGKYSSLSASYLHSFNAPDECGITEAIQAASGAGATLPLDTTTGATATLLGPNIYDVTTWNTYSAPFQKQGTIRKFFNDPRVRNAIHAPEYAGTGLKEWVCCIPGAGRRRKRRQLQEMPAKRKAKRRLKLLDQDRPLSMLPYISDLLDKAGVRVLFYNGDRDLSCCLQGTEYLLHELEWYGSSHWRSPSIQRYLWMVEHPEEGLPPHKKKQVAGYAKEYGRLQFVIVYNSGHMVPTNQPLHSLDLVRRFINNESFGDVVLPNFQEFVIQRQDQNQQEMIVSVSESTNITATITHTVTKQKEQHSSHYLENSTNPNNQHQKKNDRMVKDILLLVAGTLFGFVCAVMVFVLVEIKKKSTICDSESVTEMEYQSNHDDTTNTSHNVDANGSAGNCHEIQYHYTGEGNDKYDNGDQENETLLNDIGYGSTLI